MLLKDKTAIVTGSTRGIGRVVALEFAKEGANVVVVGRTAAEAAKEVANKIRDMGREAIVVMTDISDRKQVENLVNTALEKFSKIDILVNNAGATDNFMSQFWETTDELWKKMIDSHLMGTVNCTQAVVNHMMERKSGKIINVTSAAALLGATRMSSYVAAKGAIISLSKTLARELAPYKINVNVIAPQAETEAIDVIKKHKKYWEATLKMYLLGLPKPEDIAPAFAFLASEKAGCITGQVLCVDGGFYIG